jgi:hypothetical protein
MRIPAVMLLLCASGCVQIYQFEPIGAGSEESRVPRPRSNSQFVRAVYADLVGRAPQVYSFVVEDGTGTEVNRFPIDEQSLLVDTLDSVGDPAPLRALLVAGLVDSSEVSLPSRDAAGPPAQFVSAQFKRFLGREPGAYELRAFVDAWNADPAVGPATVVRALVESREYQSF